MIAHEDEWERVVVLVSYGLERKIWLRKWEIDLLDLDKWLIEILSFFFFFFNFKNLGTFYFEFIDLSIFSSTECLFFP